MIEPGTKDERSTSSFLVKNKKNLDNKYTLTYIINDNFEDDKTVFDIQANLLDDIQLLVLINPIINLIFCSLSDCETNEQRAEKIFNIVRMFHSEK